jgi:hypothetical protein
MKYLTIYRAVDIAVDWAAILLHILGIPGSNLDTGIGHRKLRVFAVLIIFRREI